MKKIRKVGVLGGGLMGSGIAQVSAAAGFPTTVREVSEALGEKSRLAIEKSLAKGIERGKVTDAERSTTLGNLRFVTDLKELADSDLFIEAVVEDLDVKNSLWSQLDQIARADAIFASNTSSLTIIADPHGSQAISSSCDHCTRTGLPGTARASSAASRATSSAPLWP